MPHIALAQMFARSALRAGLELEMTQGFSPRARITFGPELPAGVIALAEPMELFITKAGDIMNSHTKGAGRARGLTAEIKHDITNTRYEGTTPTHGFISVASHDITSTHTEGTARARGFITEAGHDTTGSYTKGTAPAHAQAGDIMNSLNHSLSEGFKVWHVSFPEDNSPSLGKLCSHAEYLIRCTRSIKLAEITAGFYGESAVKIGICDEWVRVILASPSQNGIGRLVRHLVGSNLITGWHEVNIVRVSVGAFDTERGCVRIHD